MNICKILDSNEYVSGIGGKRYLNENLFNSNNIKLSFQNYSPIKYTQHNSKHFIENLSILDLLMNMGPRKFRIYEKTLEYFLLIKIILYSNTNNYKLITLTFN